MARRKERIRVLVVEDSPTARSLLVTLLGQHSDIQVVGTALDGVEAVRRAAELRPDLITMDIHLPRLNGLEATRMILRTAPTPIVIVTADFNRADMDLSFEAIRAGALSVIRKPTLGDGESCAQLLQAVRLMADVPVVHRWTLESPAAPTAANRQSPHWDGKSNGLSPQHEPRAAGSGSAAIAIAGIAASTGGPAALVRALKRLPADYPLPILVVQHITRGFGPSLAEWLCGELNLCVRLAEQGERPAPGVVLLAPDDRHMQIGERGEIQLHASPPYKGLRPSANYLFSSLARVYGRQALGIILTGMGDDGVDGLADLRHQGGLVLAQDEATSVIYGMPGEAVRRNVVNQVLPIEAIGQALAQLAEKGRSETGSGVQRQSPL